MAAKMVLSALPTLQCPHLGRATSLEDLDAQETLLVLKPDVAEQPKVLEQVQRRLEEASLRVVARGRVQMSQKTATAVYGQLADKFFFPDLVSFMSSGRSLILLVRGVDAIGRVRAMVGPTDPATARQADRTSLRAIFGQDRTRNGFHASDHPKAVARELGVLCRWLA